MWVWVAPLVAVACSIPFVVAAFRSSGSRDLAVAYARRRPRQALLVCTGIVVASAMFISAVLVGDTLRASIRRSVAEQLGPIDVEAVRPGTDPGPVDAAIGRAAGGQGVTTLPMVTMLATVRGRDFIARVAQAQVVEVDFAAAQRFAGGAERSGIEGATPSGTTAVISADLSEALAITETHRVTVYAFGQSRTFTVTQDLPRRGIAGLRTPLSPAGSLSYNIFVPPGTIASMLGPATTATSGQATPEAVVAVAHAQSSSVANAVETAARATGADVRPVRQQTLDDADRRSRSITDLFRSFAFFGALAGFALLVLALAALGRERLRSMAVLRAHGLSRRGVVDALALEGWFYALVGTALGVLVGWGLGELVVLIARHVFANTDSANVELVFSARFATLVSTAAIVFLLGLATIVVTAALASRRNVVLGMRGQAEPYRPSPELRRGVGAVLAVVGVGLLVFGIARPAGVAAVAGAPLLAIGGVLLAGERAYRRGIVAVIGIAVVLWSLLVVDLVPGAWSTLSGALLVTEGLVLTGALLAVVATQLEYPRLGRNSHRRRATALASMYARQPSWRTLLVAATYATLLFMVTVLITVRGLYERDTNALAHRMGGESSLEVSSNAAAPISQSDVARLPGVVGVKAAATTPAQLTTAGASQTRDVTAVGIDSSWVNSGSPPLRTTSVGNGSVDPYAVVAHDPTRVLVGADLYADRQSGFPKGLPHVGDRIEVSTPVTGATRTLTVAGIVSAARFDGTDHVYVARSLLDDMLGKPAVSNLLFVDTEPSTNASVLAAIIDGTHLENGTYARSFVRLARESNSAQAQFLDISAGYAAVGLVAAIVAIGVVMIDRIRERRRQIAALRALGASSKLVRRSVRIETAMLAFAGMLTGVVSGVLLTWRFGRIDAFAAARGVYIPFLPLAVAVVVVLAVSILAATSAARGLARLQPARVLRANE